jgi:type I restriction enzyme, S subunit
MPKKLPKGWVKTTLGEVCAMNPRMTFDEPPPDHTEVSFVPMEAVEEESGRLDASQIQTFGAIRSGYTPFKENDVIFAKITPCMENGKIALATGLKNGLGYGSTEFFVFRPYEGLLPRFLLYFLLQPSLRETAERHMSGGVGHKRVPSSYLFNHEFLLPPTPEQARIVAKLDIVLAGLERAKTAARRAHERLQRYRAAVLNSAISGELTRAWREAKVKNEKAENETGEILLQHILATRRARWEEAELHRLHATNKELKNDKWKLRYREPMPPKTEDLPELPKGWVWATIDQLTSLVTSGSRGWKAYYSKDGATFIRSQDIRGDELNLAEVSHVQLPKNSEGMRTQVSQDDLLVTITGANVGKAALVTVELPEAYVSQHVALIRFVDTQLVRFAHIYITAPANGRKRLLELSYGAGKPGLNLDNLRDLPIPVPPLAEQAKIISEVENRLSGADRLEASLKQQLARADETRHALLHEAFAGRVVSQDPNDESAAILLERIRIAREAEAQKPKVKRMPKSRPTVARRSLLDVLRENKEPMTPEQLFSKAGFKPTQVDLFYRELHSLHNKLQVDKPKTSEAKLWPYRAHVRLRLKETEV